MRGVVYTAITAGKDLLTAPAWRLSGVDYVCFTDDISIQAEGWATVPLPEQHPDPVRSAKRPKILPHLHLPDYDWSLWVDANFKIVGDLGPLIDEHLAKGPHFAFRHYKRACAYEEPEACIRHGKDDAGRLRDQARRYRSLGMPEGLPVASNAVVLRRHNEPDVIELMEAWWREIQLGVRRDQVSFPYILWSHPNRFRFFYDGGGPRYDALSFLQWTPHAIQSSPHWP
jgi:hypothetical protein